MRWVRSFGLRLVTGQPIDRLIGYSLADPHYSVSAGCKVHTIRMSLGSVGAGEANNRLSRIAAGRAHVQAVGSWQPNGRTAAHRGGRKEGMHAAEAHT
jgi:hypothetical protein